jgi:hypothetical protein
LERRTSPGAPGNAQKNLQRSLRDGTQFNSREKAQKARRGQVANEGIKPRISRITRIRNNDSPVREIRGDNSFRKSRVVRHPFLPAAWCVENLRNGQGNGRSVPKYIPLTIIPLTNLLKNE